MTSAIVPIVLTDEPILLPPDATATAENPVASSSSSSSSSSSHSDSDREAEAEAEAAAVPAAAVDPLVPTEDDYVDTVKDRVFRWLAERCIKHGKADFKISDVKVAFETITTVYLEAAAAALVAEGKVIEPEGRSRIVVYTVDANHAVLALPPEPEPEPEKEHDVAVAARKPVVPKKRPFEGKENNTASLSSSSMGLSKQPKAAASASSSSSSSSSSGNTRPVSPFRDDAFTFGRLGGDDHGCVDDPDVDAEALLGGGAADVYKASPLVSVRLGAETAGTFLAPALRDTMISVLCDAFADSGAGVVTRKELVQLLQAHAVALGDGDVDEFLRFMADQNKAMVEGDDIYEI